MKVFDKEAIDGARNYFRAQGFEEVDVTLGEREFSYFVIPQSQNPDLPDFVLRLTGAPEDGYVLGISDNVKPEHRAYAVAHEFIEFTEIGIDAPGRCTRALEEELRLVPEHIQDDYHEMRRDFFTALVSYCSAQPQFYTSDDIAQFSQNAQRLDDLLNK